MNNIRPLGVICFVFSSLSLAVGQATRDNGAFSPPLTQAPPRAPVPELQQFNEVDPNSIEPNKTTQQEAIDSTLQEKAPGLSEELSNNINPCPAISQEFRTIDGSCTNLEHVLWGAANTPQRPDGNTGGTSPTGNDRPSARLISNIVSSQETADMPNERRLSEVAVFFGQIIDHSFVATPATSPPEFFNIPVSPNDSASTGSKATNNSELKFVRSARGTYKGISAPLNSLSSFLDLSPVYGANPSRAKALRTFDGGKLKTSSGNLLPLNTVGIQNAPSSSSQFFLAGDHRVNEHPALTAMHTIWMREHNKLCDSLAQKFPGWGDERLYHMARKINGANFQRVAYEEFFPAVTGRRVRQYQGYNKNVDPTISSLFTTAAFRIGHTMVGPDVKRRGSGNVVLPSLKFGEIFFNTASALQKYNIDEFIRGFVNQRAQQIDTKVVDVLRNFLFTNIPEELGFDLVAFNIQRGRDHQIPTYNDVRKLMGLPRVGSYSEITSDSDTLDRLSKAYGNSGWDKIDAWVGLLAEDHMPNSSVGATMYRLWDREFQKLQDSDRFFYLRDGLFSRKVLQVIRSHGGVTLRDIILRNTNISPWEIPSNIWFSFAGY